jgi:hypothetical protein
MSEKKKYHYKWDYCKYCNTRTTSHTEDGSCICHTCKVKFLNEIKRNARQKIKKQSGIVVNPKKPKKDEVILVFGDLHAPFNREGSIEFLKAVNDKYKPTKVICTGDEIDSHAMSFHETDPDNPGAGDELQEAINELKPLYKIFPKVELVDSNHGSLAFRKAKFAGIPIKYLKSTQDVLETPKGWVWHKDYTYTMNNGQTLFVTHGLKKDTLKLAEQYGCCVCQGHYHEDAAIRYSSSPSQLIWGCSVGCLIDDNTLSFEYNKSNMKRPILSCVVIINGIPQIIPMIIKNHKWIGCL